MCARVFTSGRVTRPISSRNETASTAPPLPHPRSDEARTRGSTCARISSVRNFAVLARIFVSPLRPPWGLASSLRDVTLSERIRALSVKSRTRATYESRDRDFTARSVVSSSGGPSRRGADSTLFQIRAASLCVTSSACRRRLSDCHATYDIARRRANFRTAAISSANGVAREYAVLMRP